MPCAMRLLFFGVLLLFTACNPEEKLMRSDPLHCLFAAHEREQLKNHKMILVAAGIPTEEEIELFSVHYIAFRKMKLPEVRELIVKSVEQFLVMVNGDDKLQEKLKNSPITNKNIKFNVGFGKINGEFQEPPYVAYAYLDDGMICYCYEDYFFQNFIDKENVEESYESALEIIKAGLPENEESE